MDSCILSLWLPSVVITVIKATRMMLIMGTVLGLGVGIVLGTAWAFRRITSFLSRRAPDSKTALVLNKLGIASSHFARITTSSTRRKITSYVLLLITLLMIVSYFRATYYCGQGFDLQQTWQEVNSTLQFKD